ncbi:MAG: GIY-YIG nuclease family protein [Patescibacteria group bacterium]|nr:GIY-YIG nuclease family protein [Patescibacteria group bacterium]
MNYYLYILQSSKDNNYYIGITENVEKRLSQHNSGKTKSTKSRTPFKLIYKERYDSRAEAREREKYLKSYNGVNEKREIVDNHN